MISYSWLRNLHLGGGLLSSIFLLGFAVSAATMAYPLYKVVPKESIETIAVPAGADTSPRALARWLMDARHLRGDLTDVSARDNAVSLTIARPGTSHRVQYDSRRHTARVTTHVVGAVGMLERIHHAHGIEHDDWVLNGWGWELLAVSVALLLMAATGVILWFKRHDDRLLGALVCGAGLAWGLTLLVLVRTA